MCNSAIQKLLRDLETHCFDGSELNVAIDRALPGLANETAAAALKTGAVKLYANSVRIDTAIELFLAFLETEMANNSRMRA
jgi:hypothetical protein